MLTITKECSKTISYSFSNLEDILFFDIETTGFSPKTSALYLIGVLYYKNNHWNILQWFANDYHSEKNMLLHFLSFLDSYHYLIHFNGLGFDLPYIKEKCMQHNIEPPVLNHLNEISHIDIYKRIFPHKKKLTLPNLKQKTIEQFLHIQREDPFTGGELIKLYRSYLKKIHNHNEKEEQELLQALLLHNQEDLSGMLDFSGILYLTDLLDGALPLSSPSIELNENYLFLTVNLPKEFPCSFHYKNEIEQLSIIRNILSLKIYSLQTELKFFYENYKDYFYLPMEDTAIHKSIATFVDKEYRQKAKRDNCYQRKNGIFFPIFHEAKTPVFRENYKSSQCYFCYDPNFFPSDDWILAYINGYIMNHSFILDSQYDN